MGVKGKPGKRRQKIEGTIFGSKFDCALYLEVKLRPSGNSCPYNSVSLM